MNLGDYLLLNENNFLIGPFNTKTFKEISQGENVRAIMTNKGSLISHENSADITHEDLLFDLADKNTISRNHLSDWYTNEKSIEEFICVESENNSTWIISGSYNRKIDRNLFNPYKEKFSNLGYNLIL